MVTEDRPYRRTAMARFYDLDNGWTEDRTRCLGLAGGVPRCTRTRLRAETRFGDWSGAPLDPGSPEIIPSGGLA